MTFLDTPSPRTSLCLIVGLLLPCLFAQTAAGAEGQPAPPIKAMKVRIGYLSKPKVSWELSHKCLEVLPGAEEDFTAYLAKIDEQLNELASGNVPADEVQKKVLELISGLEAREKVYGPMPGHCQTYDFPVIFRLATEQVARSRHLDIVVDFRSIYFGADKILRPNMDMTEAGTAAYKRIPH